MEKAGRHINKHVFTYTQHDTDRIRRVISMGKRHTLDVGHHFLNLFFERLENYGG